ncbi:MAG: dethiobiotin synthase [Gemmataceae bacterium]
MQGLFITATDTGAGKTEVTAAIAHQWRREGRPFAVCKPVATGSSREEGDPGRLGLASPHQCLEEITPYLFHEPAAPPVAARLAGKSLTLEQLSLAVRRLHHDGRTLLVEGVGGLLCPLTEKETVADLVQALDLPVIIVARRSLGTLNHTLLTLEAARSRRLRVTGIVISETTPINSLAEETNVAELRCRIDVPILAVVPHRSGGYSGEIPSISAVNWWSLAR